MARRPDTPCTGCGKLLWSGSTSLPASERRCRDCRSLAQPVQPTTCGNCGEGFEPVRVRDTWTQTCSKSCARQLELASGRHPFWSEQSGKGRDPEKVRANWRRRRARKLGATSEPYTLVEIAERDGYRCGLCRCEVRMDLEHPAAKSASIDHVVPLSKGGDDTRANVQLAHLGCNVAKGARETTVQLRLVG